MPLSCRPHNDDRDTDRRQDQSHDRDGRRQQRPPARLRVSPWTRTLIHLISLSRSHVDPANARKARNQRHQQPVEQNVSPPVPVRALISRATALTRRSIDSIAASIRPQRQPVLGWRSSKLAGESSPGGTRPGVAARFSTCVLRHLDPLQARIQRVDPLCSTRPAWLRDFLRLGCAFLGRRPQRLQLGAERFQFRVSTAAAAASTNARRCSSSFARLNPRSATRPAGPEPAAHRFVSHPSRHFRRTSGVSAASSCAASAGTASANPIQHQNDRGKAR